MLICDVLHTKKRSRIVFCRKILFIQFVPMLCLKSLPKLLQLVKNFFTYLPKSHKPRFVSFEHICYPSEKKAWQESTNNLLEAGLLMPGYCILDTTSLKRQQCWDNSSSWDSPRDVSFNSQRTWTTETNTSANCTPMRTFVDSSIWRNQQMQSYPLLSHS